MMNWDGKRFNNLNSYLKNKFGEKIYKLSLDGGFSCPNRDGKIDNKGCIFCSEKGSGEHAGDSKLSIKEQIKQQKKLLSKKFKGDKYIVYFQNFTNTYGEISYLKKIYYEALSESGVIGIAIATRPDCINDEVLDLLNEINKKYFLWIEMGLQTVNDNTAKFINRGYKLDYFDKIYDKLQQFNIKVVVHMILGLPNETIDDYYNFIDYLNRKKIWGIKFHMLYLIKGTNLHNIYNKEKLLFLDKDVYINIIVSLIKLLNQDCVIHRLTGDGDKESLIEPKWSLNKRDILNKINMKLKDDEIVQGMIKNRYQI